MVQMMTNGIDGDARGSLLRIAKDASRDAAERESTESLVCRLFQAAGVAAA